jgi:hypothetical protein
MAKLPDDLLRLIGKNTDDVAQEIDALVGELDLTVEGEDFAREQAGRAFDLLSNAYIDAHPHVQRARAATAAAVIAFASLKVWADHDEAASDQ